MSRKENLGGSVPHTTSSKQRKTPEHGARKISPALGHPTRDERFKMKHSDRDLFFFLLSIHCTTEDYSGRVSSRWTASLVFHCLDKSKSYIKTSVIS